MDDDDYWRRESSTRCANALNFGGSAKRYRAGAPTGPEARRYSSSLTIDKVPIASFAHAVTKSLPPPCRPLEISVEREDSPPATSHVGVWLSPPGRGRGRESHFPRSHPPQRRLRTRTRAARFASASKLGIYLGLSSGHFPPSVCARLPLPTRLPRRTFTTTTQFSRQHTQSYRI